MPERIYWIEQSVFLYKEIWVTVLLGTLLRAQNAKYPLVHINMIQRVFDTVEVTIFTTAKRMMLRYSLNIFLEMERFFYTTLQPNAIA